MNANWKRAILTSLILIFSSLAGCLGSDENDGDSDETTDSLGVVMVSTYHVGELVKAVAGDQVTLEYMSQDNIPVHDYEPTAEDIIRLQAADLFFYHGLGLEPWVEDTLASLGDAAPTSVQVHTMPDGQSTLDYESLMVSELCELMNEGPYENPVLSMDMMGMPEIHAEYSAHNFSFPEEMHDDHDEDGHDGHDDHDGHDEDGHDDHDGHDAHEGHGHIDALETIVNPTACPADTSISIFELEEGEYVLEFDGKHMEDFTMAALKMGGGHAHHHHGHGDGPFEWAGIFAMSDTTHTWSMQKVGGDYADQTMRIVLIPTSTPTETTMHSLESGVEALIEDTCTVVEDGETMASIAADGSCFELHVGTGDDSTFTIDTNGITGMAIYAQHVPTEFERDQHYLKDSTGEDIEPIAQEGAGAHGHGDHGDEDAGEHGVCHDMSDHSNNDINNEADCEAAGHIWMEEDSHAGHEGDYCHDTSTHQNTNHTTEADCEAAGHMWMEHEGHDREMTVEHLLEIADANNDSSLTMAEVLEHLLEEDHHDGHNNHTSTNGTDEDHHDEHEEEWLMWVFNHSDMDSDGVLNMTEIGHFIESINAQVPTPEEVLILYDESDDDNISWDEFWASWTEDFEGDHHERTFHCSSTVGGTPDTEISFSKVNDGTADCGDGSDEPQDFDGDGTFDNWYDCMGGTNVSMELVNNGNNDCPRGDDESDDAHGHNGTETTNGTHDDRAEHEEEMLKEFFNESDMDNNGLLNLTELEHFIEEVSDWENPPMGYAIIHIEAEGEYGFAFPEDVEFHVMMAPGSHDGHAGHDDHDGHGDEERDRDGHDDHGDEDGDHDDHDDEVLNYDPHSWLDPVAFNAQLNVVMASLVTAFPDAEDDFNANAAAYTLQLTALDVAFDAAFGANGVCMTEGLEKSVAANHNAYSYLSVRYDIQFVTVHGLDPEGEPAPEDVAKVVEKIKEDNINAFFIEEYTDNSSVQSIVDETGVEIFLLYTMEMAPKDSSDNYMTLMTKNLENLATGIGC